MGVYVKVNFNNPSSPRKHSSLKVGKSSRGQLREPSGNLEQVSAMDEDFESIISAILNLLGLLV